MLRRETGDAQNGSRHAIPIGDRDDFGAEDQRSFQAPPASGTLRGTRETCQQSMATLISDEIIPRLVAAHRHGSDGLAREAAPAGALEPEMVANLAVTRDAGELADLLGAALAAGMPYDVLLLDLLAPAARLLGARWEDDSADFVEVTLGLWRLQEVVHELASRRLGPDEPAAQHIERRILCAVVPGDDHSFGSLMLEDLFRRGGWSTTGLRGASSAVLIASVRHCWFDIIALTASVERNSAVLARLVADVRAASRNPGISVMVGGLVFNEQPELAEQVGADATAEDARAALQKAELLVGQLMVGRADDPHSRDRMLGGRSAQPLRAGAGPS
jgi:methanogenic corrinoid protein MtbC1